MIVKPNNMFKINDHECFNSVNILFNPKFYPKILKIASSIK